MYPTDYLRHVWRTINDGNGDIKVLALQQWFVFKFEMENGEWRDVEITIRESDEPPEILS